MSRSSILLLPLLFSMQGLASDCQFEASDADGDGWGWENGESCEVTDASGIPWFTTLTVGAHFDPDLQRLEWTYDDVAGRHVSCLKYSWASTFYVPSLSEGPATIRFSNDSTFITENPDGTVSSGTWTLDNGMLVDTSITGPFRRGGEIPAFTAEDAVNDMNFGLFVWESGGVSASWGTVYGEVGCHTVDYRTAGASEYYHCVAMAPSGSSANTEQLGICIDTDEDGWGWDGTGSCIP